MVLRRGLVPTISLAVSEYGVARGAGGSVGDDYSMSRRRSAHVCWRGRSGDNVERVWSTVRTWRSVPSAIMTLFFITVSIVGRWFMDLSLGWISSRAC